MAKNREVCDYCKKNPPKFFGIHLPANFDDREPSCDGKVFIAKCDACSIYGADSEAAAVIAKETGWEVCKSYDRDDSLDADTGGYRPARSTQAPARPRRHLQDLPRPGVRELRALRAQGIRLSTKP